MSYDGLQDKDLPLKLRLMNLLWNVGWFVRPNVKIARYHEGKRTNDQYTDIDVLAIRLLPFNDPIVAVSSAKSGKESDSAELFWLSGVKSYFGATSAYYIRSKASLAKNKSICDQLGIIAFNDEQIGIIEKRFAKDYFYDMNSYTIINSFFVELKDKKSALYTYLTEKFWIDPTNYQLLRGITALRDLNKSDFSPKSKMFLKYYTISLLTLPLFKLAHHLTPVPTFVFQPELETALMGGEQARADKERVIDACRIFALQIAETSKNPDISSKTIDSMFTKISKLDYSQDLMDLMVRMVQGYKYAQYMPRMMDKLTAQLLKKQTAPDIKLVTLPDLRKEDWEDAAKLAKDILVFAERIGGLDKNELQL